MKLDPTRLDELLSAVDRQIALACGTFRESLKEFLRTHGHGDVAEEI